MQERRPVTALTVEPGKAPSRRQRRLLAIVVTAALALAADQVTKALALDHLAKGPEHLIGPLSFALTFNTGIAFSLLSGLGVPIVLGVGALVVAIAYFGRGAPSLPAAIGVGLVLGGAAGNLADRIFRSGGAVVDFIHTGFWPTFNVADASVVCGCTLLALSFQHRGRSSAPAAADASEPGGAGEVG